MFVRVGTGNCLCVLLSAVVSQLVLIVFNWFSSCFKNITMPGDDAATEHKGQLPPFAPPKFNWNQDNLYEQFKSFKRVVEFAFQWQYEKCSNGIKCGSILNWLGVEVYPIYDNLSISENDKKDPSKLLDAFEHYFKPEWNIGHRSHNRSQSRKPGGCSSCGSSHPPKKYKAYDKECFHCHKKGHFSQFCCSKQHGKSLGSNVRSSSQNNRYSCHDVHEIDQSQFDDSVQFEQDSITI